MNKYGQLAMSHWKQTDPARYRAIGDKETFFTSLGEQAETEIQAMAASFAGTDPPGEEYLAKVGRLNMARLRAEEAVLSELVLIPEPEETEEPLDPDIARLHETLDASHRALFEEEENPLG